MSFRKKTYLTRVTQGKSVRSFRESRLWKSAGGLPPEILVCYPGRRSACAGLLSSRPSRDSGWEAFQPEEDRLRGRRRGRTECFVRSGSAPTFNHIRIPRRVTGKSRLRVTTVNEQTDPRRKMTQAFQKKRAVSHQKTARPKPTILRRWLVNRRMKDWKMGYSPTFFFCQRVRLKVELPD